MSLLKEISFNLGLPETPLTTDQELFGELSRVYNAIKTLAYHLDTYTGSLAPTFSQWSQVGTSSLRANGVFKIYRTFYENVTVGQLVSIANIAGIAQARLALDPTYPAHGICSNRDTLAGEVGEITLVGRVVIAGLTPGAMYYASQGTPGAITGTAGTDPQFVGIAVGTNALYLSPDLSGGPDTVDPTFSGNISLNGPTRINPNPDVAYPLYVEGSAGTRDKFRFGTAAAGSGVSIESINNAEAAYTPLNLQGSIINLKYGTTTVLAAGAAGITVTGDVGTGTVTATDTITSSKAGLVLTRSGASTTYQYMELRNTSGYTAWGTASSTGTGLGSGVSAYGSVFGSYAATDVFFVVNSATVVQLTTGAMTLTGNLLLSGYGANVGYLEVSLNSQPGNGLYLPAANTLTITAGATDVAKATTTRFDVLQDLRVKGGATLLKTAAALTDNAAAAVATLNNSPVAGDPTLWGAIDVNGTTKYFPLW